MAYYTIMNTLDTYALTGKKLTEKMAMFLDCLAEIDGTNIEEIADANDCGKCKTWAEIVEKLAELFKTGDRI
jgi:hypothetical protein